MKNLLLLILIIFSMITHLKSNDLENGIQYYKQKKNIEAKKHLEKAVVWDITGKAYYYLGNVLMNLHEYDKAISNYAISYNMNFEKVNCLYNTACAYSLKSQTNECLIYLLLSTQQSKEIQSRVSTDIDLTIFRNSKEYNQYKILKDYPLKGINPKSKEELQTSLIKNSGIYGLNTPNQDGHFNFNSDGKFFYQGGGGFCSIINVGTWEIDDEKKKLKLTLLGNCEGFDFVQYTQTKEELAQSLKRGTFYSNNRQYVWKNKLNKPVVDEIDFDDIELNNTGYFIPIDFITVAVYNKIGNYNKNSIIKYEIGRILK